MSNAEQTNAIVGIAINANSLESCTVRQHAFYLYRLFQGVDGVDPLLVFLPAANAEPVVSVEICGETTHNLNLFVRQYRLDALLLAGVTPTAEYLNLFRQNGVKIGAVVFEERYITDQEMTAFGHFLGTDGAKRGPSNALKEHLQPDAVWLPPHLAWQQDYIQHRYGARRSYLSPYIWDSELLDNQFASHPYFRTRSPQFSKNRPHNKNIFCVEPGSDTLRALLFAHQAAAITEKRSPSCFNLLRLHNARHQFEHNDDLLYYLRCTSNLLEEKRLVFGRQASFPDIIKRSSVMFQHGFGNELSYSLLEAAHLRLPVIHNSNLLMQLGYYYPGTHLTDASRQLARAVLHEERDDLDMYNKSCEDILKKYSIRNEDNRRGYQTLLANLLNKKLSPVLPSHIGETEDLETCSSGYISPFY